jgi:hypothetical protein
MAEFKRGNVTVNVADHLLPLPEKAGNLTPTEMARIPRARHGVGSVCEQTAHVLETFPDALRLPEWVTPAELRARGARADGYDAVIEELENLLSELKQANLLADQAAQEALSEVHAQAQAQAKRDTQNASRFSAVAAYFNRR